MVLLPIFGIYSPLIESSGMVVLTPINYMIQIIFLNAFGSLFALGFNDGYNL